MATTKSLQNVIQFTFNERECLTMLENSDFHLVLLHFKVNLVYEYTNIYLYCGHPNPSRFYEGDIEIVHL